MKTLSKNGFLLWIVVILFSGISVITTSCKKNTTKPILKNKSYQLAAFKNSKITGNLTFSENSNKSSNVSVELTRTNKGITYLAGLYDGHFISEKKDSATLAFKMPTATGNGGNIFINSTHITGLELHDSKNTIISNPAFDYIIRWVGHISVYEEVIANGKAHFILVSGGNIN